MYDLQDCTFTPDIVSKEESSIYLKNRDRSATFREKSTLSVYRK